MNAINKKRGMSAVILLLILALSVWFYVHMRHKQSALSVNCSTIVRYNHHEPDFVATLEFICKRAVRTVLTK